MPLDTARVTDDLNVLLGNAPVDARANLMNDAYGPMVDSAPTLGAALRASREFQGLDLEDLAQSTRIRKNYLSALEDMRMEDLPSRPFTLGYVRSYAKALGLDPEAAVARFRMDAPEEDQALRAPVGVRRERDPRLSLFVGAGVIVVIGVVAWNVAQHQISLDGLGKPAPSQIAQSSARVAPPPSAAPTGPIHVDASLPAPAESTTPTPYVTPGLPEATGVSSTGPASVTPATTQAAAAAPATPFVAKGSVYGAPPGAGTVILQATKAASLVIHGGDGAVYFAKELAPGEAYRAPQLKGITIDVSEPAAFNYFVGGQLKGQLTGPDTPLSRLLSGDGN
jgi:cytoskeleton protein RodZ